ncbi:tRNA dihydrouridine synthase DusB [Candidatus Uhrbacteria bacterium]|nr:tRNA dihydrouridine synthase DusB [Candidatus Uhrbacteria bacterium]
MIHWDSFPKPVVALAPMADMSDLPFCLISKELGASLLFREMVSAEAVVRLNPKTLEMARFDEKERPLVQQIFGANPEVMAEAARIIEERYQPDGIDINMGCPVYNIVSNFNGASLIRDPERASRIIKQMRAAVRVPISVKTRLGWEKDTDCLEFVKVLEDAGASLISIHGRTKAQGYSGKANWDRVGEARKNTTLPLFVNGDITTTDLAKEALIRSGADGILIGRGALGNPWIFTHIEQGLVGNLIEPPSMAERLRVVRKHVSMHLARYGERGMPLFRKHLAYYFKKELKSENPHVDWTEIRSALVRVNSLQELEEIFKRIEGVN